MNDIRRDHKIKHILSLSACHLNLRMMTVEKTQSPLPHLFSIPTSLPPSPLSLPFPSFSPHLSSYSLLPSPSFLPLNLFSFTFPLPFPSLFLPSSPPLPSSLPPLSHPPPCIGDGHQCTGRRGWNARVEDDSNFTRNLRKSTRHAILGGAWVAERGKRNGRYKGREEVRCGN